MENTLFFFTAPTCTTADNVARDNKTTGDAARDNKTTGDAAKDNKTTADAGGNG